MSPTDDDRNARVSSRARRRSPEGSRRRSAGRRRSSSRDKESSSVDKGTPESWNIDRGRSRTRRPSNPVSEDNLRRRGYHSLFSSFDKVFHVEKRWKMIRDMGSGAYGTVISAADEISGETVAIKQVNRVFEKASFSKRCLREITLLRHFANHENITGLIDVDAISKDFNEVYLFLEPMEADLQQIIKSGQPLTNEHVQYFLYQILRGMKYVHSASVVHRDLKPGNLLVNSDCELKICDFGLARGFDAVPDENQATHMTEYVATRWYRAPEIMLAFRRYNTAIDVWSIGCILAELIMGKPLFKGKDYVDQLNKILDIVGTPPDEVLNRIHSDKARAYVKSLAFRKPVPYKELMPSADPLALDLLEKLLAFDPVDRITVPEALEHPWLAQYHDVGDEPDCPVPYEKWRDIEKLTTIEEFREALWNEIEEYRHEVRRAVFDFSVPSWSVPSKSANTSVIRTEQQPETSDEGLPDIVVGGTSTDTTQTAVEEPPEKDDEPPKDEGKIGHEQEASEATIIAGSTLVHTPSEMPALRPGIERKDSMRPPTPADMVNDPVVSYARRSSILHAQHAQQKFDLQHTASSSVSPTRRFSGIPANYQDFEYMPGMTYYAPPSVGPQMREGMPTPPPMMASSISSGASSTAGTNGMIPFPTTGGSYIVPARSRTASTVGAEGYFPGGSFIGPRKLLRTLSTVSIHESAEGLAGGLAAMGPIGQAIINRETAADAPPSEMPRDFGTVKEEEEQKTGGDGSGSSSARSQKDKARNGGRRSGTASGNGSASGTPSGNGLPTTKRKERRFILF
ncbi:kinase-like protein [Schizopora paradoxa]|uniref:mitogen-activated protein kinase n=1 Tax=Schizopora paradoxa TaxID=27342 RepID=A0A0H2SBH3_9AGAM|nr:kinase-like protein [Schizopora paradoxa]